MTAPVTPLLPGSASAAAKPAQPGGRPRDPAGPGTFARELEQAQAPLLPPSAAAPAGKAAPHRRGAGAPGGEPARAADAASAPEAAEAAGTGAPRRRQDSPAADAVLAEPTPTLPDGPPAPARAIEPAGAVPPDRAGAPDGAAADTDAAADPARAGLPAPAADAAPPAPPDGSAPAGSGVPQGQGIGVGITPGDDRSARVETRQRGSAQPQPVERPAAPAPATKTARPRGEAAGVEADMPAAPWRKTLTPQPIERRSDPQPVDAEPTEPAAPVRATRAAQAAAPDRQAQDLVRTASGASREPPTAAADASAAALGGVHDAGPATLATAAATTLPFAAELARAGQGLSAPPAPAPAPAATELQLPTPVHDPDFVPRLSGTLALLARDGVQEARVQVHPVELGPISVQITLDGATAQVHLAVDSAMTRELLEQAMPTLAAALRENGLTLTGGGVFQQARQSPRDAADGGSGRGTPGARRGGADADPGPAPAQARRSHHLGVLDTYA